MSGRDYSCLCADDKSLRHPLYHNPSVHLNSMQFHLRSTTACVSWLSTFNVRVRVNVQNVQSSPHLASVVCPQRRPGSHPTDARPSPFLIPFLTPHAPSLKTHSNLTQTSKLPHAHSALISTGQRSPNNQRGSREPRNENREPRGRVSNAGT